MHAHSHQCGHRGRTHRAGRTYRAHWGEAALGPALPDWRPDGQPHPWVGRQGDLLFGWVPTADKASTKLYRDGKPIADEDGLRFVEGMVPAKRSTYRLEYSYFRGREIADVTTKVDSTFTFPSARTPDDGYAPMPLWTVRFTPSVDSRNAVRRKPLLTVPVRVETPAAGERFRGLVARYCGGQRREQRERVDRPGVPAPLIAGAFVQNGPMSERSLVLTRSVAGR